MSEQEAREVAAFLVIAERGHAGAHLHLPATDCDREAPAPLCAYEGRVDAWRAKEPAVYPPGYRPLCRRCLARLGAKREATDGALERLPTTEATDE